MLNIYKFTFNLFGESTYLLVDSDTKEAAVVDPGMSTDGERKFFDEKVKELGANITQIINTHLHLDHCFGIHHVAAKYGAPVKANSADDFLGKSLSDQSARFHVDANTSPIAIDVDLKDGDTVRVGSSSLKVIHTPGHTPGGISLYSEADKVVITGDTLFAGSVGRTDLGGNQPTLIKSIKEKLLPLPPETKVLSGHGPFTTIGHEKSTNPFLI